MDSLYDYLIYKIPEEKRQRFLTLDRKFYDVFTEYKRLTVECNNVTNYDEEKTKFFEYHKRGEKYFPVFIYKRETESVPALKESILNLLSDFTEFRDCVLYKYYASHLTKALETLEGYCADDKESEIKNWYRTFGNRGLSVSSELEAKAYEILKKHPYVNIESDQKKEIKDLKSALQKFCRDTGIDINITTSSSQLPRIAVRIDGTVCLKEGEKFSDEDIQSIIQHEINGHLKRKLEGLKTGLYLMVVGLPSANTYDEGIAVWQGLHKTDKPKTNTLPLIAAKYIIACNLFDKDFCELFDLYKDLLPEASDDKLFKWLVRFKKHRIYTEILGGKYKAESDYFTGYTLVSDMTEEQLKERQKYSIGPDEEYDLDKIKKFLTVNKFPPIQKTIYKTERNTKNDY